MQVITQESTKPGSPGTVAFSTFAAERCAGSHGRRSWRSRRNGRRKGQGRSPRLALSPFRRVHPDRLAHLLELAPRIVVPDEHEHARRNRNDRDHEEDERGRRGRLPGQDRELSVTCTGIVCVFPLPDTVTLPIPPASPAKNNAVRPSGATFIVPIVVDQSKVGTDTVLPYWSTALAGKQNP